MKPLSHEGDYTMKYGMAVIAFLILFTSTIFSDSRSNEVVVKLIESLNGKRSTVAILPLTDLTSVTPVNRKAIYAGRLSSIRNNSDLKAVDRSDLKDIVAEKELAMTGLAADSDSEIGKLARAEYIVTSVVEQGVVELKLVRVSDGVVQGYQFYRISDDRSYADETKPENVVIRTGWISGSAYQAYFDTRLKFGYYPIEVRGRNHGGETQYFGVYKINIKGYPWYTHHGIVEPLFRQKSAEYASKGFGFLYKSSFIDH